MNAASDLGVGHPDAWGIRRTSEAATSLSCLNDLVVGDSRAREMLLAA